METSETISKGIMITVRDRQNNKSKSFTVYSDNLDKVIKILQDAIRKAQ